MRNLLFRFLKPTIYRAYKKYLKEIYSPFEVRQPQQLVRLQNIINYAYENVPFYKNLRDKHHINTTISSLQDFESFPIIGKEDIRKWIEDWSLFSKEFVGQKVDLIRERTTGSSGTPLRFPFLLSEESDKMWYSYAIKHLYGWDNFDHKTSKLRRWSYKKTLISRIKEWILNTDTICIYDADHLQETMLTDERMKTIIHQIKKHKPYILEWFTTTLVDLALYIQKNNLHINYKSIHYIVTAAEQLSEDHRRLLEQVFCGKVVDRYGGTEASIMAHQCPRQWYGIYHINDSRIFFETVDENWKQLTGEEWTIVITDFSRHYVPFIRYKVGDTATIDPNISHCQCGITGNVLSSLWGRINAVIELSDKRKITPHIWQNIFKKYDEIWQYQVIKLEWDTILINLVLVWNLDSNWLLQKLKDNIPWCNFEIHIVDAIERTVGGKIKQIIVK